MKLTQQSQELRTAISRIASCAPPHLPPYAQVQLPAPELEQSRRAGKTHFVHPRSWTSTRVGGAGQLQRFVRRLPAGSVHCIGGLCGGRTAGNFGWYFDAPNQSYAFTPWSGSSWRKNRGRQPPLTAHARKKML